MTALKGPTVADYMQPDVVSINEQATLREAIKKLRETQTNSLVVIDDAQRVKGMLSTIDIVAYLVPDYLEQDKHIAAFESKDVFHQRLMNIANEPVSKSMSDSVKSIQPTHTLIEAATLLSEHRINQLPVIDESGKLLGYIGRTNIKNAIGDVFDEIE